MFFILSFSLTYGRATQISTCNSWSFRKLLMYSVFQNNIQIEIRMQTDFWLECIQMTLNDFVPEYLIVVWIRKINVNVLVKTVKRLAMSQAMCFPFFFSPKINQNWCYCFKTHKAQRQKHKPTKKMKLFWSLRNHYNLCKIFVWLSSRLRRYNVIRLKRTRRLKVAPIKDVLKLWSKLAVFKQECIRQNMVARKRGTNYKSTWNILQRWTVQRCHQVISTLLGVMVFGSAFRSFFFWGSS